MNDKLDKDFIDSFKIGKVTEILDPDQYRIKLSIENYIDSAIGFPLLYLDEPKVGDEIYCIPLNTILNDAFLYIPLRNSDYIGFRYDGGHIKIKNGIEIVAASKGRIKIANESASLYAILKDLITLLMTFKVLTPQGIGVTDPSMAPDLQKLLLDTMKLLK